MLFLRAWLKDNLDEHALIKRAGRNAAARLADRLLAEAELADIPESEIIEEVGDVTAYFSKRIEQLKKG